MNESTDKTGQQNQYVAEGQYDIALLEADSYQLALEFLAVEAMQSVRAIIAVALLCV